MPVEVKGETLTDGDFAVAIELAHERAHAVHLLSWWISESDDNGEQIEDLQIFADYATGVIDFATFKRRIETGEA